MTTQKEFPFKVGDKVRSKICCGDPDFHQIILYIGKDAFFFINSEGVEGSDVKTDYVLYSTPKKTIRMAHALIRQPKISLTKCIPPQVGTFLFETEERAKNHLGDLLLQWPLTINGVEQWVDVPVEDE